MRRKYIEERFQHYFEFGVKPETKQVCLACADDPSIALVTKEEANKLIKSRDVAIDMIEELASVLQEVDEHKFKYIWYGYKTY